MHKSHHFDIGAMVLSALCLVHCLALPLVIALLPVTTLFGLEDRHVHWLMLAFALPLSVFGLGRGLRQHHLLRIPLIAALGLSLMAWDLLPSPGTWGHALTVPGVMLVALAHGLNVRALRQQHDHPHPGLLTDPAA